MRLSCNLSRSRRLKCVKSSKGRSCIYCLRKSRYANTAVAAAMVAANATNRVSLFLGSVVM